MHTHDEKNDSGAYLPYIKCEKERKSATAIKKCLYRRAIVHHERQPARVERQTDCVYVWHRKRVSVTSCFIFSLHFVVLRLSPLFAFPIVIVIAA